jgi:uncharacterized protein YbcI
VIRHNELGDLMTENGGAGRKGERLAAISTGIVTLHKEYYGKGPTEAKTYAFDDSIVCVLKGGFTSVETTLMKDGKFTEVENLRRSFQKTMSERFTAVVETAIDREVIVYMSQIHSDPDVALEFFLLDPSGESLAADHHVLG